MLSRMMCAAAVATFGLGLTQSAQAEVIFCETFDGYDYFPDEKPNNDYVNLGLPLISEGADNDWYAGRFERPDTSAPITDDIAVQQFGGSDNLTPVGRVADDAGLVLCIEGEYCDVTLTFDWRSFSTTSGDELVVGYYTGEDELGFSDENRVIDFWGDMGRDVRDWWSNEWVTLFESGRSATFNTVSFDLPDMTADEPLYIAFWINNGDGDYMKIDNVKIEGTPKEDPIPEPASMALMGLGALAMIKRRKA